MGKNFYGTLRLFAVAVSCFLGSTANATLVGDTVTANHNSSGSQWGAVQPGTFTVEAGESDKKTYYWSYPWVYGINVEAGSILVDFMPPMYGDGSETFPTTKLDCVFVFGQGQVCSDVSIPFHGLEVTSLNDSSGNPLTGVAIETNLAGWDVSRLSFTADSTAFDWKGLTFNQDSYFNAFLTFSGGDQGAVPEPGTLALAVLALAALRLRKKQVRD